ncbi:unnamed protein product, partial [Iphiclides podalirius]
MGVVSPPIVETSRSVRRRTANRTTTPYNLTRRVRCDSGTTGPLCSAGRSDGAKTPTLSSRRAGYVTARERRRKWTPR